MDDKPKLKIIETVEVKKFDGDDQTQEPVEIVKIVMENGVIISEQVIRKGETYGTD